MIILIYKSLYFQVIMIMFDSVPYAGKVSHAWARQRDDDDDLTGTLALQTLLLLKRVITPIIAVITTY